MKYSDCVEFDLLYDSMIKCKRNVLWKDSVSSYYMNGIEKTLYLSNKLKTNTFIQGNIYKFKVYSPKERDIISIPFRDRVYQRSLNDNIIYDIMTKSFILDNCACQKGKGTDFARNRFKMFLRKFYNHHKIDGYILKIDIKGYYPNMKHDVAEDLFKQKLDSETYNHVKEILSYQYTGTIGYNPGSQLVQIIGISVLDKLDHIIKEKLKIKYYVRYMDDLMLIHNDRKYIEYCLSYIKEELLKIGFQININKTKIINVTDNIPFLGFNFRLTNTGKVLMVVKQESVRRIKRHIKHLIKYAKINNINKCEVDASLSSLLAFISKGNSYKLIKHIKQYYYKLWRN